MNTARSELNLITGAADAITHVPQDLARGWYIEGRGRPLGKQILNGGGNFIGGLLGSLFIGGILSLVATQFQGTHVSLDVQNQDFLHATLAVEGAFNILANKFGRDLRRGKIH